MVVSVQKGERPSKPESAKSLGFSDMLWSMVRMCWSESLSARPAAKELLRHLKDASHTWVPPPEYPIPESHDEESGLDFTPDDERSVAAGALTSYLFVVVVGVLCALLLPVI